MKTLSLYLQHFLHLFFPHTCEGCGTDILDDKSVLCAACFTNLPVTGFMGLEGNTVEKIFYGRVKIAAAGSAFYFNKNSTMQHLIADLKYHRNKEAGFYLGKLLGNELAKTNRFNTVDAIIPLPLNPRKEKKRGYNQAAVIAEGIQSVWPKPILNNKVIRKIFTDTQTHKNRVSRWQSMQGVFAAEQIEKLQHKHLLLVDDIVTTGATLEACATAILQVPGTTVSIATVAYTL